MIFRFTIKDQRTLEEKERLATTLKDLREDT